VDASGNILCNRHRDGKFHTNQLNQGDPRTSYLTKYDYPPAMVIFQNLLGSGGSANGLWPGAGPVSRAGVVVTGPVTSLSTADLTTHRADIPSQTATMIPLLARYDSNGNQTWIKQIQTLCHQSVQTPSAGDADASGNITNPAEAFFFRRP